MSVTPPRRLVIALFLIMAPLWLLLSGYFTPMLLGFGMVSCLLVVWVSVRMQIVDAEGVPVHIWSRLPRLVWELFKAILVSNRDLAVLLLRGGRNIEPTMRTLDIAARQPLTKAGIGNAITLTPGTLTTRVADGQMTIHALTPQMLEGLEETAMIRAYKEIDNA